MSTSGVTHLVRWVRACAVAETVGMAAAAAAARIGQVVADSGNGSARGSFLAAVVAGDWSRA
jgi:hypothetical protein